MIVTIEKCDSCGFDYIPKIKRDLEFNFCTPECGAKLAINKHEKMKSTLQKKAKSDKKKLEKKNKKAVLDLNKRTRSWQLNLTRISFNKMRVLEEKKWFYDRGLEPECISCGNKNMDWCCGHYKTVGAQSGLRFDRMNTYLQCNGNCNRGLSGNISGDKNTRGYTQGLLERFGEVEGQSIIDYCKINTKPLELTCEDLEAMRKRFNKRIRELESIISEQ